MVADVKFGLLSCIGNFLAVSQMIFDQMSLCMPSDSFLTERIYNLLIFLLMLDHRYGHVIHSQILVAVSLHAVVALNGIG